jgi:hypothetical protein
MLPVDLPRGVRLDRVIFRLDNLRVIGDAGDMRTSKSMFDVEWDQDLVPAAIEFTDAPTGLYSQLSLQIDGRESGRDSYRMDGEVDIGGSDYDFEIRDEVPMPITLGIEEMVTPGQTSTIYIDIDFAHAFEGVDFSTLPIQSGKIELRENDPEIVPFRQKLVEAMVGTGAPD